MMSMLLILDMKEVKCHKVNLRFILVILILHN